MSVYSNWKYFFDSFWKFVSRNSYPNPLAELI